MNNSEAELEDEGYFTDYDVDADELNDCAQFYDSDSDEEDLSYLAR